MARQTPALATLLPPGLQTALRGRRLIVGHRIRGVSLGRHRSRRAGDGQEFLEHRAYTPGDDLRRIDWRAVARHDRLVLRRDHSEDQLTLALCIDRTAGVEEAPGQHSRETYVRALAAALALMTVGQGDQLAFSVHNGVDTSFSQLRPRAGAPALAALSRALHQPLGPEPCPWLTWAGRARMLLPRRSLVVVFSDFLDPIPGRPAGDRSGDIEVLGALSSLRARGHTVVLVQSLLADELAFPWTGRRLLEVRAPGGRRPPVEGPGMHLRAGYLQALGDHLEWFRRTCEQLGLRRVAAVTSRPIEETLLSLLAVCAGQVVTSSPEAVG